MSVVLVQLIQVTTVRATIPSERATMAAVLDRLVHQAIVVSAAVAQQISAWILTATFIAAL